MKIFPEKRRSQVQFKLFFFFCPAKSIQAFIRARGLAQINRTPNEPLLDLSQIFPREEKRVSCGANDDGLLANYFLYSRLPFASLLLYIWLDNGASKKKKYVNQRHEKYLAAKITIRNPTFSLKPLRVTGFLFLLSVSPLNQK